MIAGAAQDAGAAVLISPPCGIEQASMSDAPCVNASSRLQICEHAMGTPGDVAIELRADGKVVQTWHVVVPPVFQGNGFRVVRGDLNGDGIKDVAVATFISSTNGRVINLWTVCAADGAHLDVHTKCVDVEDFGSVGYFTKASDARGCRLIQTTWKYGSEPVRGNGTYLVGRWLRFRPGGFEPDPARPLVARRLLSRFDSTLSSLPAGVHYAWFRDGSTRVVNCPDPLCNEKR